MPNEIVRVTALLGALVLLGITANALTILADSNIRSASAATNCSAIAEKTERLGCYDRLARPAAGHPFRGANAPALGGAF